MHEKRKVLATYTVMAVLVASCSRSTEPKKTTEARQLRKLPSQTSTGFVSKPARDHSLRSTAIGLRLALKDLKSLFAMASMMAHGSSVSSRTSLSSLGSPELPK